MIREATREDVHRLLPLANEFAESLGFGDELDLRTSAHHLSNMINNGFILVAEKDDEIVGLIGGMVVTSPWNAHRKILEEQIYFVASTHRNSSLGARLLKQYHEKASEFDVFMSTLKLMHNSPDISKHYEKMGYSELETTYVRMES